MMTSTYWLQSTYRLRPSRGHVEDGVSQLRVTGAGASQVVLLPYSDGLSYFVVPTAGAALSLITEDFRLETLDVLTSLWVRLRLALLFKEKKYLKFESFSLFSSGAKQERKLFTNFTQYMFNSGVALDGDLLTKHQELITGWPATKPCKLSPNSLDRQNSVAIVVHLYYEDTWPDIAAVLNRLTVRFDLIVTTVPGRDGLIEAVRRDFAHVEIEVTENRGRDVRPFLLLLERGRLDRYRYVCKVHGKKSSGGGRRSYMGALWRRRLLFELLAAPGLVDAIVERFERDPLIGMIGPRAFRLPSETYSEELSWSANRPKVLELAARMGVPAEQFRLDFFGGTMFWVRPAALGPLRELRLAESFEEEKGLLDGGLEHAMERLFATSVMAAGYIIASSDGSAVSDLGSRPAIIPVDIWKL